MFRPTLHVMTFVSTACIPDGQIYGIESITFSSLFLIA